MNRCIVFPGLVLGVAVAITTCAAEAQQADRVTQAQVSQLLEHHRGEKDAKLARRLSTLELTERADAAAVARWKAKSPGRQCSLALEGLADRSVFLDPPPSSMLGLPQPDDRNLQNILMRADDYVKGTVPRLPNLYALRTTTYFVQTPPRAPNWPGFCKSPKQPALGSGCFTMGASIGDASDPRAGPLRVTGETNETVTYRDGAEILSDRSADAVSPLEFPDLAMSGEFGPILSVAIKDALHGTVSWGYWEQGPNHHPLAVVRYRVPKARSHYIVDYPFPLSHENFQPAYHGEIAIDPLTGTIRRITIVDDPDPWHENLATGLMLQYGPVLLGGRLYICPTGGVAWSKAPVFTRRKGKAVQLPFTQMRLDDFRFTAYHLFRGDVKIIPETATGASSAAREPHSPRR